MLKTTEEVIKSILPPKGPSFEEVKKYLDKYNDEYIVIKCGGSILVDQNLFDIFIKDIAVLKKLGFSLIIGIELLPQSPTGYQKRTPQILRGTHFYDLLM